MSKRPSEDYKRLIVRAKLSSKGGDLLVSLACGHVRVMPYCSNRKLIKAGAWILCKDCIARDGPQP